MCNDLSVDLVDSVWEYKNRKQVDNLSPENNHSYISLNCLSIHEKKVEIQFNKLTLSSVLNLLFFVLLFCLLHV